MAHKPKISVNQKLIHLVVLVVGLALLAKPAWNPVPDFGKAIGEALLIALLVIYLVEVSSHQRLEETAEEIIRKIGKNIIPLIYGHELPQPLVEALEASTLGQPVYRDKMRIQVELTPAELPRKHLFPALDTSRATTPLAPLNHRKVLPGASNVAPPPAPAEPIDMVKLCRMDCTYSYVLTNCSDADVKKPLTVALERDKWLAEIIADGQSDPCLEYVRVGDVLYVAGDRKDAVLQRLNLPLDTAVVALDGAPGEDGNDWVFELADFVIPAKGAVPISFHGMMYKRHSDNEVWSTFYPTLQVDLTITSVEFEVEARFPESGKMLASNSGGMTNTWSYNAPLLTGQSVLFWWRPESPLFRQ